MRRMRTEERRARLGLRHRLAAETRASDPLEAARSVVALHSSDPATVFLSVWARTGGFEVEDLEEELYERRSLVRMLAMRRTLWVVPRELMAVVDAACTRTVASRERRRLEGFVAASGASDDPSAWLGEVGDAALRAIEARGEAFTSELSREDPLLATKVKLGIGTRWESDVSVGSRILPLLAADGKLVRGRPRTGWTNGQYRWTAAAEWLGEEPGEPDQGTAQAELLHRWLAAFGPATETDIRWWMGWTAREARAALAAVPHAVVELDDGTGYVLEDDVEAPGAVAPWVALLPTLDPTTMGWKERAWYLGAAREGPLRLERQRRADSLVGRARRRRLVAAQGRRDRLRAARGRRRPGRRRRRAGGGATAGVAGRRSLLPRLPAAVPAQPGSRLADELVFDVERPVDVERPDVERHERHLVGDGDRSNERVEDLSAGDPEPGEPAKERARFVGSQESGRGKGRSQEIIDHLGTPAGRCR